MAARSSKATTEEELEAQQEFEDAEIISDDVTERLFSELRGVNDAEVRVYAQDPGSVKLDYLFSTTGDAFTSITELYDQLRDEYGGGIFRIHVRKAGKLYRNEEIRVRAPKRRGIPDAAPAAIAKDTGGGDIVNALAAVLERSNEQNREFMRLMIDTLKSVNPPAPAIDPAAMSKSVLEGLVQMKDLVGGSSGGGTDIDTFLRIAEFTREIGGNAGESNVWDALKSTVAGLAPMLMQGMAATQITGMPPGEPGAVLYDKHGRPLPAPVTESLAAPAPQPTAGPMDPEELQKRFEAVFPMCIAAAQRNSDPYTYAMLITDQLGLEVAVSMICQPGQLDAMLAQAPQLQPLRAWFDELVHFILEENRRVHAEASQDTDDGAAHGDPGGTGGNQDDTSENGGADETS